MTSTRPPGRKTHELVPGRQQTGQSHAPAGHVSSQAPHVLAAVQKSAPVAMPKTLRAQAPAPHIQRAVETGRGGPSALQRLAAPAPPGQQRQRTVSASPITAPGARLPAAHVQAALQRSPVAQPKSSPAVLRPASPPRPPANPSHGKPAAVIQRADAGPGWTIEKLLSNIRNTSTGREVIEVLIESNGLTSLDDITIESADGWGRTYVHQNRIVIDQRLSEWEATQQLVQELSNLTLKTQFGKIDQLARHSGLAKEKYVEAIERGEFIGAQSSTDVWDQAKRSGAPWTVGGSARHEATRGLSFEAYYSTVPQEHRALYEERWLSVVSADRRPHLLSQEAQIALLVKEQESKFVRKSGGQ